jgi:hypothetical protein
MKEPGLALRKFAEEVSYNLGGEHYATVAQVVPAPVERLVFPSRRYGLPVAVVFFGVALALALWAGGRRRQPRLFWAGIGIFAASVASAAATILVHTGELGRYGVQEAYATRVATVILLGCALDAWLWRRHNGAEVGATTDVAATTTSAPKGTQAPTTA